MILEKVKKLINEFRNHQKEQIKLSEELYWANIYHDTINARPWLRNLELSPGRWAANYSLLYLIVRILSDYKPKKIIEFGLGESSKLISTCIKHESKSSTHLIIEQNLEWVEVFNKRFELAPNSKIIHCPLVEKSVHGYKVNSYKDVVNYVENSYDLYIIDGPFGSERYSRFDMCLITDKIGINNEFIIVIDDFERRGEIETAYMLLENLTKKGFTLQTGIYGGTKKQFIITTGKYKYTTSM